LLKLGAWLRFYVSTSKMSEGCDRRRRQADAQPKTSTGRSPPALSVTKISAGMVGHSFALVADALESSAGVLSRILGTLRAPRPMSCWHLIDFVGSCME